jgi:hypothetical protein
MKISRPFLHLLSFFLAIHLSFSIKGMATQPTAFIIQDDQPLSSKPLQEIATIGAAISGALIEGSVGALQKGCRHRFYCYSAGPQQGFLGPQITAKPLSIKDQPGIFPAPLMGSAFLTFSFTCENSKAFFTPIVVRPDGTIFQGFPMTALNSPQALVISSPAQTGIYTLFVLAHQKDSQGAQVTVDATISSHSEQDETFHLKPFESNEDDDILISAEFIYTQKA